jgi:phosphatidylglycerophosphate synthase
MTGTFVHAARSMNGITARAEKRALIWMAERLPPWINADHLTALAGLAMVGGATAYALVRVWPPAVLLVNVFLAINWFGDSLDGTLARVRNQQRPRYGFYVDHVLDCVGLAVLLGGMAASGLMSPMIALLLLVGYLLVSIEVYLATYCLGTFKMSFLGFGPTELRIVLAIGNVAAWIDPTSTILGYTWKLFDVGAVVAVAGLLVAFTASVLKNGRALFLAEPLTPRQ